MSIESHAPICKQLIRAFGKEIDNNTTKVMAWMSTHDSHDCDSPTQPSQFSDTSSSSQKRSSDSSYPSSAGIYHEKRQRLLAEEGWAIERERREIAEHSLQESLRLVQMYRMREARANKKKDEDAPGTMFVSQEEILEAAAEHTRRSEFSIMTGSVADDQDVDTATRLHKGAGRGAAGCNRASRLYRDVSTVRVASHLYSPTESRGGSVGGTRRPDQFLTHHVIAHLSTNASLRKYVAGNNQALQSSQGFSITPAPRKGHKSRRLTKAGEDGHRRLECGDEQSKRPTNPGYLSLSLMRTGLFSFHLALDKYRIREWAQADHLSLSYDISTVGSLHSLSVHICAFYVEQYGTDAKGNPMYGVRVRRYALNGQTCSDKKTIFRQFDGRTQRSSTFSFCCTVSLIRTGVLLPLLKHGSVSTMSDQGSENTGQGPGAKKTFAGKGSMLSDLFLNRDSLRDVIESDMGPHLLKLTEEFFGLDPQDIRKEAQRTEPAQRHPTSGPIMTVDEKGEPTSRVSMSVNPLESVVLVQGGCPVGHHCVKHNLSLANFYGLKKVKGTTAIAISVGRFFRCSYKWPRIVAIMTDILKSNENFEQSRLNGSNCSAMAGPNELSSDSSLAWQVGQVEIWLKTRAVREMTKTGIRMPNLGSYIRWLSISRSIAALSHVRTLLIAAVIIALGEGLDESRIAMAREILSGGKLDDRGLVRFEPRVRKCIFRATRPDMILHIHITRVMHLVAWSVIDDATSRFRDCSEVYLGGMNGVLRTVIKILRRNLFVHVDCPRIFREGGKLLAEISSITRIMRIMRILRTRTRSEVEFPWPGVPVDNGDRNTKGWNFSYMIGHRGVPKPNPARGLMMLRAFPNDDKGRAKVQDMFGRFGNMIFKNEITEALSMTPEVIQRVSEMSGGDPNMNVIPQGHYRNSYQAQQSQQTTINERRRAALWYMSSVLNDAAADIEKRFIKELSAPTSFCAGACDVARRSVAGSGGPSSDYFVATDGARANGAVLYCELKELSGWGKTHSYNLSELLQNPLRDMFSDSFIGALPAFFRVPAPPKPRGQAPPDPGNSDWISESQPITAFPLLRNTAMLAAARHVSNNGNESCFSLSTQYYNSGSKNTSPHFFNAVHVRQINSSGQEQKLRQDSDFHDMFGEARELFGKREFVEVEKHSVFSKRLESSEGIMQAAMHAKLPVSVADGGRFNSTRLQDAQTAKNVTKGKNPRKKTSETNTEKDKAQKTKDRAHVRKQAKQRKSSGDRDSVATRKRRSESAEEEESPSVYDSEESGSDEDNSCSSEDSGDERDENDLVVAQPLRRPHIGPYALRSVGRLDSRDNTFKGSEDAPGGIDSDGEDVDFGNGESGGEAGRLGDGGDGGEADRLGDGGKPEADGVNSNRADGGHASGDTASGKGQEISAPDGADGRAPDPQGCESRNGVESSTADDQNEDELERLEYMEYMDNIDKYVEDDEAKKTWDSEHQEPGHTNSDGSNSDGSDTPGCEGRNDLSPAADAEDLLGDGVAGSDGPKDRPRADDLMGESGPEVSWIRHPFEFQKESTFDEVKAANMHQSKCVFTRALLQKYKWEDSRVSSIKFKGSSQKTVQSIRLTRLDGFSFPVTTDSSNRIYVLHDNTGLDLIYVTELKQKDTGIPGIQEVIAQFLRVLSTKKAHDEARGKNDYVVRNGSARTVYEGRKALGDRLRVEEGKTIVKSFVGRTFHPGRVLHETNVANIVSHVGWVSERYKGDDDERSIKHRLRVRDFKDIDWVFYAAAFDEQEHKAIVNDADDEDHM